jgi:hypothetical protein
VAETETVTGRSYRRDRNEGDLMIAHFPLDVLRRAFLLLYLA